MNAFQVVTGKITEVTKLAVGFLAQAAAGLVKKAGGLSVDAMSLRLGGVLRALRGEKVSTSGAPTTSLTTAKIPLQLARDMVDSYTFDKKTGVSTFTVPAGVTDVEAMKALNEYFREKFPRLNRDAIYAGDLERFENLPARFPDHCERRDYSQARRITITGVVKGTKGKDRTTQESVLRGESLVFSDPRDQAIAAALHACKHDGEDLFEGCWCVRSSVPGFNVNAPWACGVRVIEDLDDERFVAASGSPSPELTQT
jgi:hypothetical protein